MTTLLKQQVVGEHGQVSPSISSIEKIAAAFGVTLGDLFVTAPARVMITSSQIGGRMIRSRKRGGKPR